LTSNRKRELRVAARQGAKSTADANRDTPRAGAEVVVGVLDDLLGFHLRQAHDATFRAFARDIGDPRLKPGRFAAMMIIHNNPGITQVALSRAIARDKSSITPLIQELQRLGVVNRRPSSRDRRSTTLRLTAAGERMLADLLDHAEALDRQLDSVVGEKKPELIALLRRITEALS
jgi:DNA-binding MarR family transcriptional regulator